MKRLSRYDIEMIGERVLNTYRKLPEIQAQPLYRIDPEILVEKVLKLKLDYCHLSLDGSVLGLTSYKEIGVEIFDMADEECYYFLDGKTVLVEQELKRDITKQGRCNFTTAHEAAHQIFKMLFPKEYGIAAERQPLHFYKAYSETRKPITDWEEWQANTLAAAILLPQDLIGHAMYMFGLPERIKVLNRIYVPKVYEQFANMANFLGVSKTALAIRMKQLGLLEKEYLQNPHDFVNVEYDGGLYR